LRRKVDETVLHLRLLGRHVGEQEELLDTVEKASCRGVIRHVANDCLHARQVDTFRGWPRVRQRANPATLLRKAGDKWKADAACGSQNSDHDELSLLKKC